MYRNRLFYFGCVPRSQLDGCTEWTKGFGMIKSFTDRNGKKCEYKRDENEWTIIFIPQSFVIYMKKNIYPFPVSQQDTVLRQFFSCSSRTSCDWWIFQCRGTWLYLYIKISMIRDGRKMKTGGRGIQADAFGWCWKRLRRDR